jgi:hypothetical protein
VRDILIAKLAAALCILAGLPVLKEPKVGNVGIGMLYSVPYLLAAFYPAKRPSELQSICIGTSLPMAALAGLGMLLNFFFRGPMLPAFVCFAIANVALLVCGSRIRHEPDAKTRRMTPLFFLAAISYPVLLTWMLYTSRAFDRM